MGGAGPRVTGIRQGTAPLYVHLHCLCQVQGARSHHRVTNTQALQDHPSSLQHLEPPWSLQHSMPQFPSPFPRDLPPTFPHSPETPRELPARCHHQCDLTTTRDPLYHPKTPCPTVIPTSVLPTTTQDISGQPGPPCSVTPSSVSPTMTPDPLCHPESPASCHLLSYLSTKLSTTWWYSHVTCSDLSLTWDAPSPHPTSLCGVTCQ